MNAGILLTGKFRDECRGRKARLHARPPCSVSALHFTVSVSGRVPYLTGWSGRVRVWVSVSGRRRALHASAQVRLGEWET